MITPPLVQQLLIGCLVASQANEDTPQRRPESHATARVGNDDMPTDFSVWMPCRQSYRWERVPLDDDRIIHSSSCLPWHRKATLQSIGGGAHRNDAPKNAHTSRQEFVHRHWSFTRTVSPKGLHTGSHMVWRTATVTNNYNTTSVLHKIHVYDFKVCVKNLEWKGTNCFENAIALWYTVSGLQSGHNKPILGSFSLPCALPKLPNT